MAEQGLKAVIYPELDEQGLKDFIKQLQDQMGGAYINLGINAETPTSTEGESKLEQPLNPTASTESTETSQASSGETKEPLTKEETVEAVKEGVASADKEVANSNPEVADKSAEPVKKSIGEVFGEVGKVTSSLFAGGVSIVGYVQKVWDFFENSSPALRSVMSLFETAFNLIWMPIGTIIAKELMPVLSNVMTKVADWMARAWDIYDKEGWGGLIREALYVAVDVLWTYLSGLGTVLLPMFQAVGEWAVNAILKYLLHIPAGLDGLKDMQSSAIETLQSFWDWLQDGWDVLTDGIDAFAESLQTFWDWLVDGWNTLTEGVNTLIDSMMMISGWITDGLNVVWDNFKGIWDSFTGNIKSFISDPIGTISKGIETVVSVINEIWKFLTGGPVGDAVDAVTGFFEDPVGTIVDAGQGVIDAGTSFVNDPVGTIASAGQSVVDSVSNFVRDPVGSIGRIFGFADGGIVTQATPGVFGEAGPEAVIPLNQLNQVMNEYALTNNSIGTGVGGNVMNFYIHGENAQEIGGEVQRILEKTVGKASSKMMWW